MPSLRLHHSLILVSLHTLWSLLFSPIPSLSPFILVPLSCSVSKPGECTACSSKSCSGGQVINGGVSSLERRRGVLCLIGKFLGSQSLITSLTHSVLRRQLCEKKLQLHTDMCLCLCGGVFVLVINHIWDNVLDKQRWGVSKLASR